MTWLLILHFTSAGGACVSLPVGHMVNPDLCAIAGVGMTAVLEHHMPEASVSWTCEPEVAA